MNRKLKRKFKTVGALAVTMTMATSLGLSALMASADSDGSGFKKWTSEYTSFDDVLHKGEEVNEQLAAEGFVLLKNKDNNALPLGAEERNVTLLGEESYQTQIGGGGSGTTNIPGGGAYSWVQATASSLESSLTAEGFEINQTAKELHRHEAQRPNQSPTYGAGANGDENNYMDALESGNGAVGFGGKQYNLPSGGDFYATATSTFASYGDAAIINISREGSEGEDNPTNNAPGHADTTEHYLQLNDAEREILAYAKYQKAQGAFKKIIVIVNSPAVMELGDIEDDDAFDAMLWVGVTGWNGADAIGKILTGEYNPSGRTVDFWMRDFKTDPTWYGFGNYSQSAWALYNKYTIEANERGTNYGETLNAFGQTVNAFKAPSMYTESTLDGTANGITYSEGIFMGYRYYETVAADLGDAGESWYEANTLYPFGYGLSYTNFTQDITSVEGNLSNANGKITVNVEVTNTGSVAGKDVVQVYNTPEYTEGEIDKAEVNLVGFAKTKVLAPGASETVKVTFDVKELASFDYNDANQNDFSGYELEQGSYKLTLRKNSHEVLDTETLNASSLLTWDEDGNPATPNNIYSQEDGKWEMFNTSASHWTTSGNDNDLHRDRLLNNEGNAPSDLNALAWMLTNENNFKEAAFRVLQMRGNLDVGLDFDNIITADEETDYANLWAKTAADMEGLTQGAGEVGDNGLYDINIGDMVGLDYDDPKWDDLLNQITWEEMQTVLNDGAYHTLAIDTIGKNQLIDSDGPAQLGNNASMRGWGWICEVVIASTWNTELAYEQGQVVGEETLWNPSSSVGGIAWYGPAMNTHRNPLEGRTFEYYSQDGLHGGKIAAAVVKGATDKGARVYVKHAFLNDQETSRVDSCVLINEQALRQIYAKQFELTVKEGNANGIMNSFNSIGLVTSTSYATCVQLYSNEWGYKGLNVTDFWMESPSTGWNGYNMVRGLAIPLTGFRNGLPVDYQVVSTWDATDNVVKVNGEASYTQWYWARETVKRMLYVHANSNGGRNGLVDNFVFTDNEIIGIVGDPIENVKVVDVDYLNKVYGEGNFELTGLPEGLTFNAATGIVSGTPTAPANEITLTVAGKNGEEWAMSSASFGVIYRKADLSGTNTNNATIGSEYSATAAFSGLIAEGEGQNYWASGSASEATYNNGNGFVGAVSYSAEGLPAGLTIDRATGVISGTPTVGYTVNHVTVIATVNQVTRTANPYYPSYGSQYNYSTQPVEARVNYDIALTGARTLDIVSNGTTVLSLAAGSQAITLGDIAFIGEDLMDMDLTVPVEGATPGGLMLSDGTLLDMDTPIASTVDKLQLAWTLPPAGIIDGNWWINGEDTGIPSTGIPTPEPPAPVTPENPADNAGGISAGAAAGIGIGCFAVGAGALGLVMFILSKKRKQG